MFLEQVTLPIVLKVQYLYRIANIKNIFCSSKLGEKYLRKNRLRASS